MHEGLFPSFRQNSHNSAMKTFAVAVLLVTCAQLVTGYAITEPNYDNGVLVLTP
jgi:heme A synthase